MVTTCAHKEPRGHSVRVATRAPTSRSPRETDTPAADVRVDSSMVYSISESDDATDTIDLSASIDWCVVTNPLEEDSTE